MPDDFGSAGRELMGALHPKPNTDWEEQRAVRTVAANSQNAAECAEFLEMLDLDPKKGKVSQASKAPTFNPYGGGRRDA